MQIELLLAEVCPGTEDPDNCVARLPEFWMAIGAMLWPGYYEPTAEWMCGNEETCPSSPAKLRLSLRLAGLSWIYLTTLCPVQGLHL